MKWLSMLIQSAVGRNNGKIVYPCYGRGWEDCYSYDAGYHILCYHKSKDEKTCHEIAIDDNGVLLGEE